MQENALGGGELYPMTLTVVRKWAVTFNSGSVGSKEELR
jgi:hypothetical protein